MKKLLAMSVAALLFAGCSTTTNTTIEPVASPEPTTESYVSPSPVVAAMVGATLMPDGSMQVKLSEQNMSAQSGIVTLAPTKDNKVMVTLALTGGSFAAAQPAHIHVGSCPTPGAVKYPLTNVVSGKSTTTLNVTMADLLKSSEHLAINVHKSASEQSVYTACGDIQ